MDTAAVLELIQDVAARVITPRFRSLTQAQVMEKNPGDLVTVADREAEVLLTEALVGAYPQAVVLGEEAHSADGSVMARFRAADHAFTVDPVDGTKNFVAGSADHAVMVAEIRDGETTRAWIWQPQHGRAYVAERGAGVRRDGVLVARDPVVGRPDVRTSHRRWVDTAPEGLDPLTLTWVCCGVDYPHLIEGAADAILYTRDNPWDHAPGALMVTEAGGFVGTHDGTAYAPQREGRGILVAADRQTYDLVQQAVARW